MSRNNQTILVFAPHPDDEVLGVGGTMAKVSAEGGEVIVCIATECAMANERKKEAAVSNHILGVKDVCFLGFPDLSLSKIPNAEITQAIREVIETYKPDIVFTPHPGDLHTDHKALTAAVLVAIRPKYNYSPKEAYTYETLSETGLDYQNPINVFSPNTYVDISETIDKKIKALEAHETQVEIFPHARSLEGIETLSVYRGIQARMKNAEAFSLIRRYGL